MSYDKSRPKRCTDAFARMMRDAVDRMLAAGHETVWFGDGATFWLFTVNPERSDAIRKRLAGGPGNTSLLCDGCLGPFDAVTVTEDATEEPAPDPDRWARGLSELLGRAKELPSLMEEDEREREILDRTDRSHVFDQAGWSSQAGKDVRYLQQRLAGLRKALCGTASSNIET